ncbi:MAG: O-antigen ligase family protein, partial [Bacteroidales bacterium]|nr:O-antigen ligase family protein [Bacteroidales bacterium]
ISSGIFSLEVKLSFLAIPLILGFQKADSDFNFNHFLKYFSIASIISPLILFARAFYIYFSGNQFPIYSPFSPELHVTYLAAYSTINLLINYFIIKNHPNLPTKILAYFSILITFPIIWVSQSKAGMLIFLMIISILVFKEIVKFNKWIGIISISVLVTGSVMFINTNPRFKAMFEAIKHYEKYLDGKQTTTESTAARIMTWDASLKIIKENFWIGVGNGDAKAELLKKYDSLGYQGPARLQLNAHNQYLETMLYTGILGLIFLLGMFFLPIVFLKQNTQFFWMFAVVYGLHFLFESMLNTQAGVIFFVFMYCIIIKAEQDQSQIIH